MKTLIHRVVGKPPGKGAPHIEQLRWVRRLLLGVSAPTMVVACVVLIIVGIYLAAAIFAAVQVWSLLPVTMRVRREERRQRP